MVEQAQTHAKQIELAADALKNDSLATLQQRLKDKTQELEELKGRAVEHEVKANSHGEELKTKLY